MERISGRPRRSSVPLLRWNWYLAHRFQSCSLTKDLREQYPQFLRWSSGKITTGWSRLVWIGMFSNYFTQSVDSTHWEPPPEHPWGWPDLGLGRWISINPQDPDCDDAGYAIVVENFPTSCWTIPTPVKTGFNGVFPGIWTMPKIGLGSFMPTSCQAGAKM